MINGIKVYNFEVEDWHTYFVSDIGVLVHNRCDGSIFSERALEHIFHGNINGRGNVSGYHKENIMSKATVSNVGRVDSKGIYEATINIDGHTKNLTFFHFPNS